MVETEASIGGGAFPTATLPSFGIAITEDAAGIEERLRMSDTAVIGRIADGVLILDMRTVLPGDQQEFLETLSRELS